MCLLFCSIGNNFTQPTGINILRYIHFSTVCTERDSLKMGQLWRQIAGLGSHLIDLKISDMILSQKCNNAYESCFFMHTSHHGCRFPFFFLSSWNGMTSSNLIKTVVLVKIESLTKMDHTSCVYYLEKMLLVFIAQYLTQKTMFFVL
jgi:hypothetical protein